MANSMETEVLDAPPKISAALKKKILSDPNTEKIAKELKMDLETFVNTVGYYINNPGAEPSFLIVSDENLRKNGFEPPTAASLTAVVRETVAAFEAANPDSGFDEPRKKGVDVRGDAVKKAPAAAAKKTDLKTKAKK
jgi:hypothetical protein